MLLFIDVQGNKYEFVDLVEASVVTVVEYAYIVVTFKARQSDDIMVTFKANTHSASKSLIGSYDIETVVPLHSDSDMSSASGSKSDVI